MNLLIAHLSADADLQVTFDFEIRMLFVAAGAKT
jgi:hypothetical protein